MARTALVNLDIEGARKLIEALDKAGFPVGSAFWFYNPDSEEWRLFISSPEVDKKGPLRAYKTIQPVLKQLPEVTFGIDNIAAVGTKAPLVSLMRSAIKTGPGTSGIRLTRNVINGTLIEDAYVYRLQQDQGRASRSSRQ